MPHAQATMPAQLSAMLCDLLPSGEPGQQEVCARLGLSPRSVQRRLAQEHTTFRDVLNATRHQLALTHLKSGQHSVSEVAFLLGFAEVSAFTRAFKRWTGASPRAWRQQALDSPPRPG
jgi:AraC-like DNA-binding protein